jgi:hypothetical protein
VEKEKDGDIHIGGVQGDVSGVSVGGSGNIVGKNIEVGILQRYPANMRKV